MAQPAQAPDPTQATVTIGPDGKLHLKPNDPLVLGNGKSATITFTAHYPTPKDYSCELKIQFVGWKKGPVADDYTVTVSS